MNITLKDVPKPIYQRLKKTAAQSGRRGLPVAVNNDRAELLERIRRRREAMPFVLDLETMQRAIDEGRE